MVVLHGTLSFLATAAVLLATGCDKKGDDRPAAAPPPSAAAPAPSAPTPPTGSTMGKPVDACSMLAKADAEDATGEKPLDSQGTVGETSVCTFLSAQGVKTVILSVLSLKDPSSAKQLFDARAKDSDAETAPGFGDAAYWKEFMGAQQLHILKGSYVVKLQVGLVRSDGKVTEPERRAAVALAGKVLGKLP